MADPFSASLYRRLRMPVNNRRRLYAVYYQVGGWLSVAAWRIASIRRVPCVLAPMVRTGAALRRVRAANVCHRDMRQKPMSLRLCRGVKVAGIEMILK